MLENGRINIRQLVLLFITSRIILNMTYFPASKSPPNNQDLWLGQLLSIPAAMLLAIPIMFLAAKHPQQTIIQYSQTIAGKFAGKILGILYLFFFLHQGAIILRQFGEFMVTTQMPETPIIVFIIGLAMVAAYTSRNGLEVISRSNEIFFPLITAGYLLVFILIAKDMDFSRLAPLLDDGILPVLDGSFSTAARYVEFTWLAMVYPFFRNSDNTKVNRAIVLGIVICGLQFVLSAFMVTTTYGYPMVKSLVFPVLGVAKAALIQNVFERIESIIIAVWIPGMIIKAAILYYVFVLGSAQLLNLKDYKPIVLPAGIIMVAMSILLFANQQELFDFTKPSITTPYILVFILVIPIMLLIIELLMPKKSY